MIALIAQYGGIVFAALTALISVWYAGKIKGAANAQVKAAEQRTTDAETAKVSEIEKAQAANSQEIKTVSNANEALTDVNSMPDNAVLDELRRDYTRD